MSAGRIAAARAAHDGFSAAVDDYLDRDGKRPDYSAWAFRLSFHLGSLLGGLDAADLPLDGGTGPRDAGNTLRG